MCVCGVEEGMMKIREFEEARAKSVYDYYDGTIAKYFK